MAQNSLCALSFLDLERNPSMRFGFQLKNRPLAAGFPLFKEFEQLRLREFLLRTVCQGL